MVSVWPRTTMVEPRARSLRLRAITRSICCETLPRSVPWTAPKISMTGAIL